MVKPDDKIRRFGVVLTPLSGLIKEKIYQIMARRISIQGCEDFENTFAWLESDFTLRFGFKVFKSVSYA